jgi:hypothetical protein
MGAFFLLFAVAFTVLAVTDEYDFAQFGDHLTFFSFFSF